MASRNTGLQLAGGLFALLALHSALPASAQSYRWKDERGITHYGDGVPPKYKDSATVELSTSAVPVRANDASLTAAQRAEQEGRRAAEAELAKKRDEFERIDRALMSKYANVTELARAHQQAVVRYDDELSALAARAQSFSDRAFQLIATKKRTKEQSDELASLSGELTQASELIERKLAERVTFLAQQKAERDRFEALMGGRGSGK